MTLKVMQRTALVLAAPAVVLGLPIVGLAETFRLEEATVADINAAFDAGALTSAELVQLYLNRVAAYDQQGPSLNSIIAVNPNALQIAAELDRERELTGPRSPLHGIPVILKDNYDTFDVPTTAGSVLLKDSIPPDDAFTVKQFRDAGAIILGKANLSEFASGRAGYGSLIGQTLNPYNLNRNPSGSSGGTGVAIAANFGVIGTGSDTGGSIRGPAAANGIVGIKPTLGLTSRDGIIPLALSFDVGGPMTRTVTDAAIALGVMTGIDPNDPRTLESEGKFFKDYTPFLDANSLQGARIGVARDFFGRNDEVDQGINTSIAKLEELGATVVDSLFLPTNALSTFGDIYTAIRGPEFKAQIPEYLATLAPGYPTTLAEIIALSESPAVANSQFPVDPGRLSTHKRDEASGSLTSPAYLNALNNGVPLIRNALLSLLDGNNLDAIIYPTSGCPAGPIAGLVDPTYVCRPGVSPTNFANISGFPDIQVPAGFTTDGLPFTLSFLGRAYSESALLGFAYAYEQATLFRRPPSTTPPLPGEEFEYERVPEPSPLIGLMGLVAALGLRRNRGATEVREVIPDLEL